MKFTVNKTTLGKFNRGHCGNPNNARYRGSRVVWEIVDATEGNLPVVALTRKQDALKMADWLNEIDYDHTGDPLAMFMSHLREVEDWETFDKIREV